MSLFNRTSFLKAADATAGSMLCRILGSLNHFSKGDTPTAPINLEQIRRILIIRPGGMGDMIVLLPVVSLLKEKYPQAAIDIVCEKRNVAILKLAGMTENALVYDTNPLGFLSRLRSRKYDVAVDTEQFHHFSAVFALLSKAPARIGFKINPTRNPLYTHLINYAPDGHEGEQFMRLIEPLGITNTCYDIQDALPDLKTETPPAVADELKEVAGKNGFAVIHAGTSSELKLWAEENWVKLSGLLHEKRGLGIVLIGGKGDGKISAQIVEGATRTNCRIVSFAGKHDLGTTSAVIKQASVFIGSDSGLAHLATALGVPSVVLFGPSDHLKWGTQAPHHAVAHADLPCSPCFIFGYHKHCRNIACMKQISVDKVFEAVEKVI